MDVAERLAEQGCRIIEAANADDALRLLERNGHIDLVFTDVDMPGQMNGLVLANEICRRWPDISIIVTSGKSIASAAGKLHPFLFFSKPYCPDTIHAAIREKLG